MLVWVSHGLTLSLNSKAKNRHWHIVGMKYLSNEWMNASCLPETLWRVPILFQRKPGPSTILKALPTRPFLLLWPFLLSHPQLRWLLCCPSDKPGGIWDRYLVFACTVPLPGFLLTPALFLQVKSDLCLYAKSFCHPSSSFSFWLLLDEEPWLKTWIRTLWFRSAQWPCLTSSCLCCKPPLAPAILGCPVKNQVCFCIAKNWGLGRYLHLVGHSPRQIVDTCYSESETLTLFTLHKDITVFKRNDIKLCKGCLYVFITTYNFVGMSISIFCPHTLVRFARGFYGLSTAGGWGRTTPQFTLAGRINEVRVLLHSKDPKGNFFPKSRLHTQGQSIKKRGSVRLCSVQQLKSKGEACFHGNLKRLSCELPLCSGSRARQLRGKACVFCGGLGKKRPLVPWPATVGGVA